MSNIKSKNMVMVTIVAPVGTGTTKEPLVLTGIEDILLCLFLNSIWMSLVKTISFISRVLFLSSSLIQSSLHPQKEWIFEGGLHNKGYNKVYFSSTTFKQL